MPAKDSSHSRNGSTSGSVRNTETLEVIVGNICHPILWQYFRELETCCSLPNRGKFERRSAVAVITLNRSEQANSLDLPMAKAFFAAAAECGDPSVRAMVLTGAGRNFCFGGDLGRTRSAHGARWSCSC
jgi:hypothetical protein